MLDTFLYHFHTQCIEEHKLVISIDLSLCFCLQFSEKEHEWFCWAESFFAKMVVSPVEGLVSLQFDEISVAFVGKLFDDRVGLEPSAIQQYYIAYFGLYFWYGFTLFMRVEDVCWGWGFWYMIEHFFFILFLEINSFYFPLERIEVYIFSEESYRCYWTSIYFLGHMLHYMNF